MGPACVRAVGRTGVRVGVDGSSSDRRRDLPVDRLSCAATASLSVLAAGDRRGSVSGGGRIRFVRRPTADLELVRTGGIRLSN